MRVFTHAGRATGAAAISLRVVEFLPGRSPALVNAACDEVLYVLEGTGTVLLDDEPHAVEPGVGFYVRPDARFAVENPGPAFLAMFGSRCPDPGTALCAATTRGTPGTRGGVPPLREASRSTGRDDGRPLVPRPRRQGCGEHRGHAVRGLDPARPRARPLSRVRGGPLHPDGKRPDVGRAIVHADRSRLMRLPAAPAGALRGEHGRGRASSPGSLLSRREPSGAVRPNTNRTLGMIWA